jgi:hypothetical protein
MLRMERPSWCTEEYYSYRVDQLSGQFEFWRSRTSDHLRSYSCSGDAGPEFLQRDRQARLVHYRQMGAEWRLSAMLIQDHRNPAVERNQLLCQFYSNGETLYGALAQHHVLFAGDALYKQPEQLLQEIGILGAVATVELLALRVPPIGLGGLILCSVLREGHVAQSARGPP